MRHTATAIPATMATAEASDPPSASASPTSMVLVEVVVEVVVELEDLLVVDDVDTVVDDSEEVVVGLDEVVDKDVAVVALELDELEDVDVDVVVLKLLSLVKVAGNTIAVASSLKTTSSKNTTGVALVESWSVLTFVDVFAARSPSFKLAINVTCEVEERVPRSHTASNELVVVSVGSTNSNDTSKSVPLEASCSKRSGQLWFTQSPWRASANRRPVAATATEMSVMYEMGTANEAASTLARTAADSAVTASLLKPVMDIDCATFSTWELLAACQATPQPTLPTKLPATHVKWPTASWADSHAAVQFSSSCITSGQVVFCALGLRVTLQVLLAGAALKALSAVECLATNARRKAAASVGSWNSVKVSSKPHGSMQQETSSCSLLHVALEQVRFAKSSLCVMPQGHSASAEHC